MAQPTIAMSDNLLRQIDQNRARRGASDGNVPSRSEWFREAAREKLGVEGEGAA